MVSENICGGKCVLGMVIILGIAILGILGNANAATINVPADYPTIQQAIDNASNGDTIVVAAGTYIESITINKSINLVGETGAVIKCPSTPKTANLQESSHTFEYIVLIAGGTYNASNNTYYGPGTINVNITGFEINGSNNGTGIDTFVGILARNAIGNISNNYIHHMYGPSENGSGEQTFSILVYGNSDLTVYNNTVKDFSRGGIVANGDAGTLPDPVIIVKNNVIYGNGLENDTGWWAENGLQFGWGASGTVEGNKVYNCRVNNPSWASSGIIIVDTHDLIINNNTIVNCDKPIGVEDASAAWGFPWNVATIWNITITNNTLDKNTYGISIANNVTNVTILYNEITNTTYDAIDVWNYGYGDASPTTITIHYNNIYNNGWGLWTDNNQIDTVNATLNWWGNAAGPYNVTMNPYSTGDGVEGNVKFIPWLDAPYPGGNARSYNVFIDSNGNGVYDAGETPFNCIQTAIDAAIDNDTIKISPGVYRENLVIDKPLKIVGDPTIDANGSVGINITSSNVLVENMTIYNGSIGIDVYNTSLNNITINNCTIYNMTRFGIRYYKGVNDSTLNNVVIYNVSSGGIYMLSSSNITIYKVNSSNNEGYGLFLSNSRDSNVKDSEFGNNDQYGIYLQHCSNITVEYNYMHDNKWDGLYAVNTGESKINENLFFNNNPSYYHDIRFEGSNGNELTNNTFAYGTTYETKATIIAYYGNFTISGVATPPSAPAGFANIDKFLDVGGENWMNLTVYYDSELVVVNESTLHIWKYNDSAWYHHGWYNYQKVDVENGAIVVNFTLADPPIYAPLQDIVPPTTIMDVGTPNYDDMWVNFSTPIWLNASDNANGSGVNATYYRIWYNNEWHPIDENDSYCGNDNITEIGGTYWYVSYNATVNFNPIHFCEECMHYLEYYSVDNAGNEEELQNATFYVDDSPPEISFELGNPLYINATNVNFTTSYTPIYLNATDIPKEPMKLNGTNFTWVLWRATSTDIVARIYNYADTSINITVDAIYLSQPIDLNNLTWNNLAVYSWTNILNNFILNEQTDIYLDPPSSARACLIRYNVSWNGGEEFARIIAEAIVYNNSGTWQINYTLINFDILNNYSMPVNDFELELYNSSGHPITPDDIYDYYHGWWTPPEINNLSNGIELIWRGEPIEAGNWIHFGLNISKDIDENVLANVRYNWTVHCGVGSYGIYYRIWNNVTGWSEWYSDEWNSSVVFNLSSVGDYYGCIHYIEYYAIDDLGNNYTEPLNQTIFVDNMPPTTEIIFDGPSYYENDAWYVTSHTNITFNTTDLGECPSGLDHFHWEAYVWNGTAWESAEIPVWNGTAWENRSSGDETEDITIKFIYDEPYNEHCYLIRYYGIDNLGNYVEQETEFRVDNTPPFAEIQISSGPASGYYVTTHTYLRIHAEDRGACPVESVHIKYNIWSEARGWYYNWSSLPEFDDEITSPFNFTEECRHSIWYNVSDDLGNYVINNISYKVDDTPPSSYAYPANGSIVGKTTAIIIQSTDPGECAIDSSTIHYRIWNGSWSGWIASGGGSTVTLYFNENCTHYLEFWAEDSLGNAETSIHNYTYYVDDTPPETGIDVGKPNVSVTSNKYYVTSHTPIWLNSSDTGCNDMAAGVKELHYIITYDGQPHELVVYDNQSGDLNPMPGIISTKFMFSEECNHTLEYWSIDNVSNEEEHHIVYFLVDDSSPLINKTIGEPQYEKDGKLYITSNTPIWVNATDTGLTEECTVASVHINVSVYSFDTESWEYYEDVVEDGWAHVYFTIDEECKHWINITVWDDLNNTVYHNETVYVDNSPPVLHKEVGEPKHLGTITETEIILYEDFEGAFPPEGWTVIENGDAGGIWKRNDEWGSTNYAGGYGYCAEADSDAFGSGTYMDTELWTPILNLSVYTSATLSFIAAYNDFASHGDYADVDISIDGGVTWTNLLHWDEDHDIYGPGELVTIDLTPYVGNSNVIIRWHYGNATWDWYWQIDNVTVTGEKPSYYITSHTPIYLNITDAGSCIVGSLHIKVGIYNGTSWNYTWYNSSDSPLNLTIFFHEECMHWLNITMYDDLGNVAYDNETFYVDDSKPEGSISIENETSSAYVLMPPLWVNVTAWDMPECAASGVKNVTLYYRYSCDNATWTEWNERDVITEQPYSWYFESLQPGYYEFYAMIYDNLGHVNVTKIARLAVPLNLNYILHKGWNLITVPIDFNGNAWDLANYINIHNNLSINIVTTIIMLNSMQQRHVGWVASVPDYNNFSIEPGMGYWIYVTENATITWHGKPAQHASIQLHTGYNLVGWIDECNMATNASNVLEGDENMTIVIGFNVTIEDYVSCYKVAGGIHGNRFDIKIGDAFYIYVTREGTWTGRT